MCLRAQPLWPASTSCKLGLPPMAHKTRFWVHCLPKHPLLHQLCCLQLLLAQAPLLEVSHTRVKVSRSKGIIRLGHTFHYAVSHGTDFQYRDSRIRDVGVGVRRVELVKVKECNCKTLTSASPYPETLTPASGYETAICNMCLSYHKLQAATAPHQVVLLQACHAPSVYLPPLSSRSEKVCLASSDLPHTHLALAGTCFIYCY